MKFPHQFFPKTVPPCLIIPLITGVYSGKKANFLVIPSRYNGTRTQSMDLTSSFSWSQCFQNRIDSYVRSLLPAGCLCISKSATLSIRSFCVSHFPETPHKHDRLLKIIKGSCSVSTNSVLGSFVYRFWDSCKGTWHKYYPFLFLFSYLHPFTENSQQYMSQKESSPGTS